MNLYDHIQELRAELANCVDWDERLKIEAELAGARAELAYVEAHLDEFLEEEPPH